MSGNDHNISSMYRHHSSFPFHLQNKEGEENMSVTPPFPLIHSQKLKFKSLILCSICKQVGETMSSIHHLDN